jgi:hypothetical protein
MNYVDHVSRGVATLSDEQLLRELESCERCALLSTRTRRQCALLRLRCICAELERRGQRATPSNIRHLA